MEIYLGSSPNTCNSMETGNFMLLFDLVKSPSLLKYIYVRSKIVVEIYPVSEGITTDSD